MKKIKYLVGGLVIVIAVVFLLEKYIINDVVEIKKTGTVYEDNYRIKFLGSSRTVGNLIPTVFDETNNTYNYGLVGTGNKVWLNQLGDLINDGRRNLIVINVDNVQLSLDEGSDGNYVNYIKVPQTTLLYQNLNSSTKERLYPFPLYHFGSMTEFVRLWVRSKMELTKFSDNGCSIELNMLSDKDFYNMEAGLSKEPVKLNGKTRAFFESLNKTDKLEDILVFINLPNFDHHNNQTYHHLKNNYPNIGRFIDLDTNVSEREYYFDKEHLSKTGAEKITADLKDSLRLEVVSILR